MKIAGFDIGGANTDLAVVEFDENGNIIDIRTEFSYLPMWIKKDELSATLLELLGTDIDEIDAVGVSMTAELADSYQNKSEGVLDISARVMESFNLPVAFVGLNGMMNYDSVRKSPQELAAANWIATAPLAAHMAPDCIFIDTGSTTTDIIPIKNGMECAKGRSDLERLATGELVYTGTLRTNVATLVDKIPLKDEWVRTASELFAVTADVHLVLGNITPEDYTSETPDGEDNSREASLLRLSRVVCGDMDLLSQDDVVKIARFIYQKQTEKVAEALKEVSERENIELVIATGLGMSIIGCKAAELLGLEVRTMEEILTREDCVVAPAVGTALLMEKFLETRSKSRDL
ncbi:hydantoinase/oxoprolinase family protein [Methanobacterium sp.]|uniref:hydantoinase/oxoprolinase family protein n=1 Tax=Methanobacterium sp. TaxID=2164 RepID=UPI002AB99D18|nr:hydantoinase/oxoprolinase family protein [Methanobacterium sp.]MDY9922233.1 hydantoinase/oxoprolinase family protein [Methanobacterium sp.]